MKNTTIILNLRQKISKIAPLFCTFKIDLGNEKIYIDGFKKNTISFENKPAQCTIKINHDNFIKLLNKKLSPTWGVFTGKIIIEGNKKLLVKLQPLLS